MTLNFKEWQSEEDILGDITQSCVLSVTLITTSGKKWLKFGFLMSKQCLSK